MEHLETRHKDEKDVKHFSELPKGCKARSNQSQQSAKEEITIETQNQWQKEELLNSAIKAKHLQVAT